MKVHVKACTIIYLHNGIGTPTIKIADEEHWKQIQKWVHEQEANQERIILSNAIQEKIDKFADLYFAKSY